MSRAHRTAHRGRFAIAVAAAALLVGGVALAGGFADVPRERLPVRPLGDTYENALYSVSVRSVRVVDREPVSGSGAAQRVVVADVDLLFRGDAPTLGAARWLSPLDTGLPARPTGQGVTVVDERNGLTEPLQPGLPLRAVYTWTLPATTSVEPGDRVRLGVYERYEVDDAAIDGITTSSVLVAVFRGGAS